MNIVVLSLFLQLVSLGKAPYEEETYLDDQIWQACISMGTEYDTYGVTPELIMAMVELESSGNPNAENGSCKGLMQISEVWHEDRMERLSVENIFDVWDNILLGTDYIAELLEQTNDLALALDLYNGNANAYYYYETNTYSPYAEWVISRTEELTQLHYKYYRERENEKQIIIKNFSEKIRGVTEMRDRKFAGIGYSRYDGRTLGHIR